MAFGGRMIINKLKTAIALVVLAELIVPALAQSSTVQILTSTLCGIIGGVRAVIGVIALALFLLGGVLYASAHFLPSAGNLKPQAQGWSMAMLIGGVIGIIFVILAPLLVNIVIQFNSGTGTTINPPSCP